MRRPARSSTSSEDWSATPFAAIDPEDYYDYQVNRPTVRLVDGVTRRIDWPTTRLSIARLPGEP